MYPLNGRQMHPEFLQITSKYQLLTAALFLSLSLALWPESVGGVAYGSALMAFNFWSMRALFSRILGDGAMGLKTLYSFLLMGKFAILLGLMAVVVLVLRAEPFGFAAGMFTLFLAIVLAFVHTTVFPGNAQRVAESL